jgi:hypothetical protein
MCVGEGVGVSLLLYWIPIYTHTYIDVGDLAALQFPDITLTYIDISSRTYTHTYIDVGDLAVLQFADSVG